MELISIYAFLLAAIITIISDGSCGDVKPQKELYFPDYRYYHNVSRIISHLQVRLRYAVLCST